jgi:hypothetical protein
MEHDVRTYSLAAGGVVGIVLGAAMSILVVALFVLFKVYNNGMLGDVFK